MSIIPPLDRIPKLPGKGVNLAVRQFDRLTDKLLQDVLDAVKSSSALPTKTKCSDPEILKLKQDLDRIRRQIENIQRQLPKVQTAVNTTRTIISTAQAVNAVIAAAQLSNPITAPLFIATQLQNVQNATIVNAIESLSQLSAVPATVSSKLTSVVPALLTAINNVSTACNGEDNEIALPQSVIDELQSDSGLGAGTGLGANSQQISEWYTDVNVSDSDLSDLDAILKQQQTLLRSIIEAPSVVFKENGTPDAALGKSGDYYIDLTNQKIYGPKIDESNWGDGITY